MGLELEFKYALTGPGQLEELRQELEKAFGPWEAVEMETVYYDTPDQALAARHWTLRVRQENGRPVLTVKTPGPGRARGEWELPGGGLADLSKLQTLGAPWEVTSLQPDQLLPRCGCTVPAAPAPGLPARCRGRAGPGPGSTHRRRTGSALLGAGGRAKGGQRRGPGPVVPESV